VTPAFIGRRPASRLAALAAVTVTLGGVIAVVETAMRHDPSRLLVAALAAVLVGCAALLLVVPIRTRLLNAQARTLRLQEAILEATAFAAERLASSDGLEAGLAEDLERLGRATGASRVYTFRNDIDEAGRLTMSIAAEWTAPGIAATITDPQNQDHPYARFSHWEVALGTGAPVQMTRSQASEVARLDMDAEGVLSLLAVPVFVGDTWWGFIGFDDCERERTWSRAELDALRATAVTLGVVMATDEAYRTTREAEERYRALVEHLPGAVYIDGLDNTASTLYMSPVIESIVGYTVKEWEDDPDLFPKLLHPEDREAALEATARHNESGEPFRMDYRLTAKDGRTVWIRDEAVVIYGEDGNPLYSQGIMQDITEAKAAQERISYLSYHDALTGLANRAMFTEVAGLALARARRNHLAVAVLFLDLDAFKLVNDSLGPEGGDRLLRQVAERLSESIRDTDTLARRSGDEFLVLLPDLEPGELAEVSAPLLYAETVAGRIRGKLDEPFEVDGAEIFVSASVGISVGPKDADDVAALLAMAEEAMFQSKRSGPGGLAASQVGTAEAQTKLEFVTKLRKAVGREEWVLHYQPIVELATGLIKGVEALVRWRTADGEMIPPNEFIPLAEELGLIGAIGDWVVEEVARQDETWLREGIDLEMGFNLSPRQFWQEDLAERILGRLEAKHVDPTRVVVELTESLAMRDPDRAQLVLADLHARGLRLAIDDFGTGYSSLSRLRNLPIDVLKIDRSFISEVDKNSQAARIVAAFIQLGQGLGMTTLAEGIETEEERRFLIEEGCELGQGYFFCRPVPADQLTERFRAGQLLVADGR
jgi:diguanylate cyclase (GGDEF)-like protein/PAS domain S-box-containing protein